MRKKVCPSLLEQRIAVLGEIYERLRQLNDDLGSEDHAESGVALRACGKLLAAQIRRLGHAVHVGGFWYGAVYEDRSLELARRPYPSSSQQPFRRRSHPTN
jgi:hypothetical protein